jgi:hypothetical protein
VPGRSTVQGVPPIEARFDVGRAGGLDRQLQRVAHRARIELVRTPQAQCALTEEAAATEPDEFLEHRHRRARSEPRQAGSGSRDIDRRAGEDEFSHLAGKPSRIDERHPAALAEPDEIDRAVELVHRDVEIGQIALWPSAKSTIVAPWSAKGAQIKVHETYNRTAASFSNPDFVEVVIHSYRHRMANAAGDPRYATLEARLATLPKIGVPTIVIHGAVDDVNPAQKSEGHFRYFTGHYERRLFENVGHNPPQEAPKAFAEVVLDLCKRQ